MLSNKDPELVAAIQSLEDIIGESQMVIIDHWEADRLAIGVGHLACPGRLVYIALRSVNQFDVVFEGIPTEGTDLPYQATGGAEALCLSDMCAVVTDHLRNGDQLA